MKGKGIDYSCKAGYVPDPEPTPTPTDKPTTEPTSPAPDPSHSGNGGGDGDKPAPPAEDPDGDLAHTGSDLPVGWIVSLAAALAATGAVLVGWMRRRRAAAVGD